ncbi:OmpA family protein [Tropicimonas sp. IMCC34011]|uniref:OmpA family protein n=1 Tax=Tropicimonas sp. IMCC34011 TaxID=2248759 RepID=UPI000E223316|nr:OmpA family protein [Tropicimonas sp. IMCC34011]
MTRPRIILVLLVSLFATAAAAQDPLELPPMSRMVANTGEPLGSYEVPISQWRSGAMDTLRAEGAVSRKVWQVDAPGRTTMALMAPLVSQLEDGGWDVLFRCEARACGGFDFRYATEVAPEPDMHVDLGDYRFLAARRGEAQYMTLLVSRSAGRGFIQMTTVAPEGESTPRTVASTKSPLPSGPAPGAASGAGNMVLAAPPAGTEEDVAASLAGAGRAVLDGLTFATGSAELGAGGEEALDALATWMSANPGRGIVLVGHTDAVGGLSGNVSLSARRAEAVRQRLIGGFGIAANRLRAEGVGYLSPLTSNDSEAGRQLNRRVEAVAEASG